MTASHAAHTHATRATQTGSAWERAKHALSHPHGQGPGEEGVAQAATRNAEARRALVTSLVVLGATALLQGGLYLVTGSSALLADTFHNVGDALVSLPLLVALHVGLRARDARHTHGWGRVEDLAGLVIVVAIAASALLAAYAALRGLEGGSPVRNPEVVVGAGLLGILGNEVAARIRIRAGRRTGSAALVADGLHARTDAVASAGVVLAGAGALLGFSVLDPVIGLVIALVILLALRRAAKDVLNRLIDAVDPELVEQVQGEVRSVPGVEAVPDVRLRWSGHELLGECDVTLRDDLTLVEAHDVCVAVEERLRRAVPLLSSMRVHPEPVGAAHPR